MRTTKRVMINVATRWLATLTQGVLGLFVVRFLLEQLGQEGYGLTALMGVLVSFAALADLGLGGALSRHLAAQLATGNQERYNELASTAFTFYLAVGSALAVACGVFAPAIAAAFNPPPSLMDAAVFLVRWYAAPAVLLSLVSPAYWGVLASANRFDIGNWIAIGTNIVRTAALLAVLGLTTAPLLGWSAVSLFSQALSLGLTAWAAYHVRPGLRVTLRYARVRALSILFSTSTYLFALQLTNLLSVKADPFILTTFLGPAAVALYAPAATLITTVRPLVTTLVDQLHPLATVFHESGDREKLLMILVRGTKYTLLLGVGACVMLASFAGPITSIWLGRALGSRSSVTAQVLILFVAVELLAYAAGSQWAVLLGMNRLKFLTWTQLPLAVANVVASAALVGLTRLGVVGVVIPTLVIALIRRPLIIVHAARLCGVPVCRYLREAYLRPTVVLVLLTGAAVTVRLFAKPSTLGALLGWGGLLGVLFAALCWWAGLNPDDRDSILNTVGLRSPTAS